jgi:outer membrane protein OmpA-like peptidoglycan-associated protein
MSKKGVIAICSGLFLALNAYCFMNHGLSVAAMMPSVRSVTIEMPPVQVVPPEMEQKLAELLLQNRIEFQTGSAKLTSQGERTLLALLPAIQAEPATKLTIQGHTDSVGLAEKNQSLSEARAQTVARYLEDKGIAKDRLLPVGFGQAMPLADNSTVEGRQANRRIEFKVREE